jgi:hypothetical protein
MLLPLLCVAGGSQAAHAKSWDAVDKFMADTYPIHTHKTSDLWARLPPVINSWDESLPPDSHYIVWVNFPCMGAVSSTRLEWIADYVADRLTAHPLTSAAIILSQTQTTMIARRLAIT